MVVIPSQHRSTLRVLAPGNVFENTNVTFAQVDHAMLRWPELASVALPGGGDADVTAGWASDLGEHERELSAIGRAVDA